MNAAPSPARLRLLSWNVARQGPERAARQAAALVGRRPDVVALQEVAPRSLGAYLAALAGGGLPHTVETCDAAAGTRPTHGQVIASRWPLALLPNDFRTPRPESVLSAVLDAPAGAIELHSAHVPNGSGNGLVKVITLERLYARLACATARPRLLCGDFNAPQAEFPDGRAMMWHERMDPSGRIGPCGGRTPEKGEEHRRWAAAERGVLCGLARFDLADAFRRLHGEGAITWSYRPYSRGG